MTMHGIRSGFNHKMMAPHIHQVANMVFIEQPTGVGFSYDIQTKTEDLLANDEIAARDNEVLVTRFFEKFPQYADHDFYISGESYGGHYVPGMYHDSVLIKRLRTSDRVGPKNGSIRAPPKFQRIPCRKSLYRPSRKLVGNVWHILGSSIDTSNTLHAMAF